MQFLFFKNYKSLFIGIFCLIFISLLLCVFNIKTHARTSFLEIEPILHVNSTIDNITKNRIYIIGDSRMALLEQRGDSINVPPVYNFIAVSGTKIDWFSGQASDQLNDWLKFRDNDYQYHVVINMGVNDLNDNLEPYLHASNYYKLYRSLASKYSDVKFYILSVNPIDDDLINEEIEGQKRSTSRIEKYNDYIVKAISNDNLDNLFYCDSYDNVKFEIPDGLHYNEHTDKEIVYYIANKCIDYK